MKPRIFRTTHWKSAFYFFLFILTWNVWVDFTEGLTWIAMPSQINKCIGQTANLTWKFIKKSSEEIRQLQWLFNTTHIIAYSSVRQGFTVDIKYRGRVEPSGETGILIHNLSDKDIGNYVLYPLIAWTQIPNIQSVWLNVIEPKTEHWCTCENVLQELRSGGRMLTFGSESCNIQINSSFCCVTGPTIQYCENDPQKLCVPISLPKNTTQSIAVTEQAGTGLVSPHITKEEPDKVPPSQASAFRPWIQYDWSAVVAMVVLKFGPGF